MSSGVSNQGLNQFSFIVYYSSAFSLSCNSISHPLPCSPSLFRKKKKKKKKCHCFSSTVTLIAHSQAPSHNSLFYTIKWLFVKIQFRLNPPQKIKIIIKKEESGRKRSVICASFFFFLFLLIVLIRENILITARHTVEVGF